jgi:hypothetical protein
VSTSQTTPDYEGLIRFLVQPFLESPEALRVDCEMSPAKSRVWVRLAFEGTDKGRVFGRGGRNIQAIRTILEAVAKIAGHSAYLDVYGATAHTQNEGESDESARPVRRDSGQRRSPSRR